MLLAALALLAAATGPNPGDQVPAFTLPDQSGQPRSLASLQGPKGLVLLFFRSADW
ncbi:MAG: redoxin domain-containing protein [Bryobacterales bacterium]|nr:redoxin domain-containing protein [Bryobacterales bacterium]